MGQVRPTARWKYHRNPMHHPQFSPKAVSIDADSWSETSLQRLFFHLFFVVLGTLPDEESDKYCKYGPLLRFPFSADFSAIFDVYIRRACALDNERIWDRDSYPQCHGSHKPKSVGDSAVLSSKQIFVRQSSQIIVFSHEWRATDSFPKT